jgi:hypothetical protein
MEAPKDFADLCSSLTAKEVNYLVVGGLAVGFHGAPRFTGGLDLWIGPQQDNVERMLDALAALGFTTIGIEPEYIIDERKILQIGRVPHQVHFLTEISGVNWDEPWESRNAGICDGKPVWYIGLEALVVNKRSAVRLKDQADVDALTRNGQTYGGGRGGAGSLRRSTETGAWGPADRRRGNGRCRPEVLPQTRASAL